MGPAWEVRLQQMKDSWEVKVSPDPTRPALASFIPTPAQPPFSSPYTKGSLLIAPHELTLNEKPIKFKITKSMHTLSITQHGGKEPPCVQNTDGETGGLQTHTSGSMFTTLATPIKTQETMEDT